MTDMRTYAWIFLSIPEQPVSLQDVISVADGINHAIPMQKELQESFGWLQAQGLIRKEGKKYLLTEAGVALNKSIRHKNIMSIWDEVTKKLSRLPEVDILLDDISEADIISAYRGYRKWFREASRKWDKKKGDHEEL